MAASTAMLSSLQQKPTAPLRRLLESEKNITSVQGNCSPCGRFLSISNGIWMSASVAAARLQPCGFACVTYKLSSYVIQAQSVQLGS